MPQNHWNPYAPAMYQEKLLTERQISAEALTRQYLSRIEAYNPALNAVAELNPEALPDARRLDASLSAHELPLFGLPVLIKDNIDVAGLHTTAGSMALADHVAAADAPVVANLRRNGAVILGKTNMTEFANYTTQGMPGGFSSLGGQVRHAYDAEADASGSSTGSAVAVSAGLCAAAVGTDTSFSVVGCATVHGLAGLKPPHGVLSGNGIVPIAHTLDSAAPLARTFGDALLLYSAMRGTPFVPPEAADTETLRIAVNCANRDMVSKQQLALYEDVFDVLRAVGTQFEEINQPHTPHQKTIMNCEFRRDLEAYLCGTDAARKTLPEIIDYYKANPACMPYGITYLEAAVEITDPLHDAGYREALAQREHLRTQTLAELRDFDACVMTGPTNLMHFIGLPSLALPLGMGNDGLPRGIILYGADERRLYAAAKTIEKACRTVIPPRF